MIALADFFDSVLHGLLLVSLALTLGGVAWALWGLRAWQHRAPQALVRRCLAVLGSSALVLALCQAAVFALRIQVLSAALGTGAMEDFLATAQFAAGAARTLLALGAAAATL